MNQENRIRQARAVAASPLFLAAAIAATILPLMNIYASSVSASFLNSLFDTLSDYLRISAGHNDSIYTMMELLSLPSGSPLFALISQAPNILFAVGLWLIFAAAKQTREGDTRTATGVKLVDVYMLISLVLKALTLAGVIIILITAGAVISKALNSDFMRYTLSGSISSGHIWGIMTGLGIGAAIGYGIQIWFIRVARRYAASAGKMLTEGAALQVSKGFRILCHVLGALSALSALGALRNLGAFLGSAALAAIYICLSLCLKQLDSSELPPPTIPVPAFAAPPVTPALQASPAAPAAPAFEPPAVSSAPQPVWQPEPAPQPVRQPEPVQASMPNALLLQRRNGDNIPVEPVPFIIGRNSGMCSFAVTDNPKVSGRHAAITYTSGGYCLTDLHSTNHTYLNNQMLRPDVPVVLSNQSLIRLGNEEFVFILY